MNWKHRHEHHHGYCSNAKISIFLVTPIEIPIDSRRDAAQKISTIATLLTSVDNSTQNEVNATDKLFKIKLIIDMVRQQYIKVESELHSIDEQIEQIIPCKTKRSKIRHITRKEKKMRMFSEWCTIFIFTVIKTIKIWRFIEMLSSCGATVQTSRWA